MKGLFERTGRGRTSRLDILLLKFVPSSQGILHLVHALMVEPVLRCRAESFSQPHRLSLAIRVAGR